MKSAITAISKYVKKSPLLYCVLRPVIIVAVRIYARVADLFFPRDPEPTRVWDKPDEVALFAAASRKEVIGIGRNAAGHHIVMLVVSDLRVDPRVEREARALASAGYAVTVICPDPTQGHEPDLEIDWGARITFELLHWSSGSFVMYRPGYVAGQLFARAMNHQPLAFHAHDLTTAYAARAAARITGAHLVVDFHEWFSENVRWNRKWQRWEPYGHDWRGELQVVERLCLAEASEVITVCDSIADAMAAELGNGRRPVVIRNVPQLNAIPTRDYVPLKQQFGLPDECFVLLYQGGTGTTRLLEPVIEALAMAPRCTLVIRGPSLDSYGEDFRKLAQRAGASERLILAPPVPSRDVVAAARGASGGIYTVLDVGRNFRLALPNKIFEYMAANVPVLSAHYPEPAKIVAEHRIGLTFDPHSPRSIAAAINRMIDDPAFAAECRANTQVALSALGASREWEKIVAIYCRLESPSDRTACQLL
jgi:glycosyltransferase involved in cell wall biosynthesis